VETEAHVVNDEFVDDAERSDPSPQLSAAAKDGLTRRSKWAVN
jgi:hypothetical protein